MFRKASLVALVVAGTLIAVAENVMAAGIPITVRGRARSSEPGP